MEKKYYVALPDDDGSFTMEPAESLHDACRMAVNEALDGIGAMVVSSLHTFERFISADGIQPGFRLEREAAALIEREARLPALEAEVERLTGCAKSAAEFESLSRGKMHDALVAYEERGKQMAELERRLDAKHLHLEQKNGEMMAMAVELAEKTHKLAELEARVDILTVRRDEADMRAKFQSEKASAADEAFRAAVVCVEYLSRGDQ
jgi:hypothetical protein